MFTLDPLLRRLFMHYTPLEDFPKLSENFDNFGNFAFPVHEICMALFYRLRSGVAKKEVCAVDFSSLCLILVPNWSTASGIVRRVLIECFFSNLLQLDPVDKTLSHLMKRQTSKQR